MKQQREARRANPVLWDGSLAAILLAAGIGIFLLVKPAQATSGVVFDNASRVMSLRLWGFLFLVKAGVAGTAHWTRRVKLQTSTVIMGLGLYMFWTLISILTAIREAGSGTLGALLFCYVAFVHWLLTRAFVHQEALWNS